MLRALGLCTNQGVTFGSSKTDVHTVAGTFCASTDSSDILKLEQHACEDLGSPKDTLQELLRAPSDESATSASSSADSRPSSSDISVISGVPNSCDSTSDDIDLSWSSLEEEDPLNAFTAHLESLRRPTKVRNQMKDRRIRSPALEKLDELNVPLQIRHLNHSVRGSIPVHLYYEGQFFEIAKLPVTDFAAGSRRVYCDSIVALGRWMESKALTLNLHSPIRSFENHHHHG